MNEYHETERDAYSVGGDTMIGAMTDERRPCLVMMVGIPASGKSTEAAVYAAQGYIVLSSDDVRARYLAQQGMAYPDDEAARERVNRRVFEQLTAQAVQALRAGENIVLDATNLHRRRRMAILTQLRRLAGRTICRLFVTPHELCLARNATRDDATRVPPEAMQHMLCSFDCPVYQEGWDVIEPVISSQVYRFPFEQTVGCSQDNPHHTLTLYEHLRAAHAYAQAHEYPAELQQVALYHDIGKLYTKSFVNTRGECTSVAHFYGHEHYGAYLYLTEMCCGRTVKKSELQTILYNTALIGAHMRPLHAWSVSPKARAKDVALFGEAFVRDIERIHQADRAAH